jgi:hypothetical protein
MLVGIMVLLGVGTLLPFNVFITERTFYEVPSDMSLDPAA